MSQSDELKTRKAYCWQGFQQQQEPLEILVLNCCHNHTSRRSNIGYVQLTLGFSIKKQFFNSFVIDSVKAATIMAQSH